MIKTTAMRIPEMRWKKDAVDANRKKSIAMRMRWALSRKAEEREGNARKERGGGVLNGGGGVVCQNGMPKRDNARTPL
jgi:hypothetical protein